MDQEKRIAYLVKNDWSTAPVPTEYRRSNYGVVATLVGQIIALSGIYIGAGMVGGLTLTQAFIATVIGSIILAVLGGFLSWVGTKTGVGLSMLLRESFGTIGSYIVSLMLLLVNRRVKGSMSIDCLSLDDAHEYHEWSYTTARGETVSVYSGSHQFIVLYNGENAFISLISQPGDSLGDDEIKAYVESVDLSALDIIGHINLPA